MNILKPVLQCPATDVGLGADVLGSFFGDAGASLAADAAVGGLADAALPTIAITAPAAAATGIGLGDVALGATAAGLGGEALGASTGGGPIGGGDNFPSSGDITDAATIGPQTLASNNPLAADISGGGPTALMPTTDSSVTSLSPDLATQLGVGAPPPAFPEAGADAAGLPSDPFGAFQAGVSGPPAAADPAAVTAPTAAGPAQPGGGGGLMSWLSKPKNLMTAGMLGISGINALSTPKLPGAASTALDAAGPAVKDAMGVINSGGMSGLAWTQQKASIDSTIDQQIAQLEQQIQQNAATSGQGGANSGLVQQQIAQAKQQLETQRQNLYAQAAQQNVQTAVAELSGGDATLASIAQMQLSQSNQARQRAALLAQLAAQLNQSSMPGG